MTTQKGVSNSSQDKRLRLAIAVLLVLRTRSMSRTTLNKILFFADAASFIQKQELITGQSYIKMHHGPVPEDIDQIRSFLIDLKLIQETEERYSYGLQYTYSLTPDLQVSEQSIIDHFGSDGLWKLLPLTANKLGDMKPSTLSTKSHEFEPWKSSDFFEPMEMAKVKDDRALLEWLTITGVIQSAEGH